MLSIQIDTKSLEFGFLTLVQQHQIVLFASLKEVFHYVRILNTLEYICKLR